MNLTIIVEGGGPMFSKDLPNRVNPNYKAFQLGLRTLFDQLNLRIEVQVVVKPGASFGESRNLFLEDWANRSPDNQYWLILDSDKPKTYLVKYGTKVGFMDESRKWKGKPESLATNGVTDREFFLMVSSMESWLLADLDGLRKAMDVESLNNIPEFNSDIENETKPALQKN